MGEETGRVIRLLWTVTAVAVALSVGGFALVGVAATSEGSTDGVAAVGAVVLAAGLAVLIYAAVQWVRYLSARRG